MENITLFRQQFYELVWTEPLFDKGHKTMSFHLSTSPLVFSTLAKSKNDNCNL